MNHLTMRTSGPKFAPGIVAASRRSAPPRSGQPQSEPMDTVQISNADSNKARKWGGRFGTLALAGIVTAGALTGTAAAGQQPSADGELIVHHHSDGSKSTQVGDFTRNPDGSLTTRVGNLEITNGKVSAMRQGDTVFHSDGSFSRSQGHGLTVRSNGQSTFAP